MNHNRHTVPATQNKKLKHFFEMNKPAITKDIYIEDLVNNYLFSIKYLSRKGIKCIACGEPVWGTLEEAAKEKGFDDAYIKNVVEEMNEIAAKEEN